MEKVRDRFMKEEAEQQDFLSNLFGWRRGEPGNKKIVQDILKNVEEYTGLVLPRSAKAREIQMSDEAIEMMEDRAFEEYGEARAHPFIAADKESEHCGKMIGTYLKDELVSADGRVHPYFSPLVKTGRTSCSRPNIQNIPRKGGIRGIYVAPVGKVLFACDYVQAELCSLAETCYRRYKKSVMRDVINSGEDLHQWFGDIIMKESKGSPNDGTDYRQMAKPCNFGFPGGLGKAKFQQFAKGYGVDLTRDDVRIVVDEKGEVIETVRDMRYIAQTINGRSRRNATYCSACNYSFQGLVADGAKIALWYLYQRGYKVVNFIHDEVIVELPLDDRLQHSVKEISALMIKGMQRVIHHVEIRTDGALMRRWYKEAKNITDEDGNLLIWEPNT